jgi:hypothetical protein
VSKLLAVSNDFPFRQPIEAQKVNAAAAFRNILRIREPKKKPKHHNCIRRNRLFHGHMAKWADHIATGHGKLEHLAERE